MLPYSAGVSCLEGPSVFLWFAHPYRKKVEMVSQGKHKWWMCVFFLGQAQKETKRQVLSSDERQWNFKTGFPGIAEMGPHSGKGVLLESLRLTCPMPSL